jgi:hypothetical protein
MLAGQKRLKGKSKNAKKRKRESSRKQRKIISAGAFAFRD